MQQAAINKDLIGEEPLYYTNGWYYYKYFTMKEEYCYIEDNCFYYNRDSYLC